MRTTGIRDARVAPGGKPPEPKACPDRADSAAAEGPGAAARCGDGMPEPQSLARVWTPCAGDHEMPVITLRAERLAGLPEEGGCLRLRFRCLDEGDAYSEVEATTDRETVPGSIRLSDDPPSSAGVPEGDPGECVRVVAYRSPAAEQGPPDGLPAVGGPSFRGFVRQDRKWKAARVMLTPGRADMFARAKGILETDVLAGARVFVAGLGSVGSHVAIELANSGVGRFILVDHDRVEAANVMRHVGGLSDVGRYKTKVMAERIRDRNPFAQVETREARVEHSTEDLVRDLVVSSDLVICSLDEKEARLLINRVCVQEGKPMILPGAFRRAHGGQILFVKPRVGPCHQCFVTAVPDLAQDQEVATPQAAERLAYSDRPVAAEPGLSNDIAPINQMTVKLAITHLLGGRPTTMGSLAEDLSVPFFVWINRREAGTNFERLRPLQDNVNGMRILRWYGASFPRDEACPCCGDPGLFAAKKLAALGEAAAGVGLPKGDPQ